MMNRLAKKIKTADKTADFADFFANCDIGKTYFQRSFWIEIFFSRCNEQD